MNTFLLFIIIAMPLILIFLLEKLKVNLKNKNKNKEIKEEKYYLNSYKAKRLFTENEQNQLKDIKDVTDRLNLLLFAKVRLADVIEPIKQEKYYAEFNKIKAKHLDFVICNQNLDIVACIEIDDNSHLRKDRIERDFFVNAVLANCNIKLIRTYNIKYIDLESMLKEKE